MQRLFTSIAIDDSLRGNFLDLFETPRNGVRPSTEGHLHVTLPYVGAVTDEAAATLKDRLVDTKVSPICLSVDGVGCFDGKAGNRFLYARVVRSRELLTLHEEIERVIASAGLPLEERAYNPHITLARIDNADSSFVDEFVEEFARFQQSIEVDSFALMRVNARGVSPHYQTVRRYPLA